MTRQNSVEQVKHYALSRAQPMETAYYLQKASENVVWMTTCYRHLQEARKVGRTALYGDFAGSLVSTMHTEILYYTNIYPLVAPRGGPAPEIVDPSGCFPEGPDPPIKSRGPSLAFVNQTFLLTLNLDKGTNTLEQFGRS